MPHPQSSIKDTSPREGGRVWRGTRRVRMSDCRSDGRLKLEALARYLQDLAADDVRDGGIEREAAWVLRWVEMEILGDLPRYETMVALETWCSAAGAAWAERRTRLCVGEQVVAETGALGVSVDPSSGRPMPLTPAFDALYGSSIDGRKIRSSLHLQPVADQQAAVRLWPLRAGDVDLLRHVNNTVSWAVIDDLMARWDRPPLRHALVEYRQPILPAADTVVAVLEGEGEVDLWFTDRATLGDRNQLSVAARVKY